MADSLVRSSKGAIPIVGVSQKSYSIWLAAQATADKAWLGAQDFKADPHTFCLLPDPKGKIAKVIVGLSDRPDLFSLAHLPLALPVGDYKLEGFSQWNDTPFELGWALGAYQFTAYKKAKRTAARLVWRKSTPEQAITDLIAATYLTRDLVNTPAQDMDPVALAKAAKKVARQFKAQYSEIVGEQLLKKNYPMIHAVGRASNVAPRLIDLRWGSTRDPKITLIGKGVCFDSGGLDLKTASGMLDMKKDMGGAAHALSLAYLIMAAKLPVRLRVLIPAVENAVSGNAFHPGDIIKTRKGMTVEIGNTDAEGRLILCDVLAEAVTEKPALVIDFATLTGAARVAVGTEIGAFFTRDAHLASRLSAASEMTVDPLWQLPLYEPYRKLLNSDIADINNVSTGGYGGAITAALFLREFVPDDIAWVHLDIMASNMTHQPGRPKGGEAMGLRACFYYLQEKLKHVR